MSAALYLGLNPALQRRVDIDGLAVGSVNRARFSSEGIGGKGQGAFVAALRLAEAEAAGPRPRLCMFLGSGREGDRLEELLARRVGAGVAGEAAAGASLWERVAAPCRICTTLVDAASGDATEIVEPSGAVTPAEWEAMLGRVEAAGAVAALGVHGSAPPGVPADAYAQLVVRACGPRTKVLVDSVADVHGTLRAAAAPTSHGGGGDASCDGRVMLKLNARELLRLVGRELRGSDSQVAADFEEVVRACREIAADVATHGGRGVDYVCFTDGPFPAGVVAPLSGRVWELKRTLPLRAAVVSPIGAGDSTSAGTLHAWCLKDVGGDADAHAVESFRFGLAVGAASCLTGENALFDVADVWDIHGTIAVNEIC